MPIVIHYDIPHVKVSNRPTLRNISPTVNLADNISAIGKLYIRVATCITRLPPRFFPPLHRASEFTGEEHSSHKYGQLHTFHLPFVHAAHDGRQIRVPRLSGLHSRQIRIQWLGCS